MTKKNKLIIVIITIFVIILGVSCVVIMQKSDTQNVTHENELDSPKAPSLPKYEMDKNTEDFEMDAVLAKSIREYLDIDKDAKLTKEMLENITDLYIWENKLVTLKGIEYLKNLEILAIGENYLTDITELTKLENIKQILISSGYIKEIPDFSKNLSLTELHIIENSISDIEPILNIPNIKFVDLKNNFIKSISKVKDIQNLEMLDLSGNVITDYGLIKENKSLQKALPLPYAQYIKVENKAKEIVENIIIDEMSEIEKEAAIHEYIVNNIEYSEKMRSQKVDGYYSIIENQGVCGDYAEAMAILGTVAGLDVIEVNSSTHAWNIIKIDEEYYHVDTLWNDEENTIKYFNRSSEYILSLPHHTYDLNRFPIAKKDMPKSKYSHLLKEIDETSS